MIEAPSHLITLPGGGVRVLRLAADRGHLYALRYDVPRGMRMCRSLWLHDDLRLRGRV